MSKKKLSIRETQRLINCLLQSIVFTCIVASSTVSVAAEALLYDNSHHPWSSNRNAPSTVLWTGPSGDSRRSDASWFDAQPFRVGGHDNVSSVSIRMARDVSAYARGSIRLSVWDANEQGLPGEEVGELGAIDIADLERFDFPGNQGGKTPPVLLPEVTFEAPIDDLVPGETYFVVRDYRDIDPFRFGDVIGGLSNSAEGTNHAGSFIATDGTHAVPPFRNNHWLDLGTVFGANKYAQMRITAAGEAYGAIPCTVGDVYFQDFDSFLGDDGTANVALPPGWAFFDQRSDNGQIFNTFITEDFPIQLRLPTPGASIYNAGATGDTDRALAIGVPRTSGEATLQLVTDVVGEDARSIQLAFDIEAWDTGRTRSNPGEAAFNVVLDLDTGNGFELIKDLGQVTTGALAPPPREGIADGNEPAYRTSFNTGPIGLDLPAGSRFRVRWMADQEASTRGWVFGLDNVSLGMFADITSLLGDFDSDSSLTAIDINLLSSEIHQPTGNSSFDINGDGKVDMADHQRWVEGADYAATFVGDADLNQTVDFADFLALSTGFGKTGGWDQGDFDGNGNVDFSDFLLLSANYNQSKVAATSVPEPSGFKLAFLALGLLGWSRKRSLA